MLAGAAASACAFAADGAASRPGSSDGAVDVFRFNFEQDEDRDFDRHPDGWIRRKGREFPSYLEAAIDRGRGRASAQSLRFKVNGGAAAMYSRPMPIDPFHSYLFRGYIRTQRLEHDAALVSISLLNHKRQRVQRFLTRPVTGTFKDWCEVDVGPIVPRDDVHFVVVGCHVVHGARMDIGGSAWFDDLWMGRLPLFSLESNSQSHFREREAKVIITSQVDGIEPERAYRLDLKIVDAEDKLVASKSFDLDRKPLPPATGAQDSAEFPKKEKPIDWTLEPLPHGFYAVDAVLLQDGKTILAKKTSFAVMDPLAEVAEQGEFGWTVLRAGDMPQLKELAEIASQAGINWMKFPLWSSVAVHSAHSPAEISAFFDDLARRHVTPIGLFNDPPAELRGQFARNWMGISEIFTMRTDFWRESIEHVIARYSSHVRHWQLGEEDDESFVGMSSQNLAQMIARVKAEFDRVGRDTRIGVHWNWESPPPARNAVPGIFLSMTSRSHMKDYELVRMLQANRAALPDRWVLIKPLPASGHTPDERGSDLVKQMVEAKIGRAEKIFADDVFNEETGLLHSGGAPSLLFLPWRTTALALAGSEYIGSFQLPEGSRNYAFSRNGEVSIIVWNGEPVDEDLYLGGEAAVYDVLGRRIHLPPSSDGRRARLHVGPSPLLIRHFPEPVARWMLAVSFEKARLPSKIGKQRESIRGENTFRQGVNGQVRILVPKDWKVDPPELRFVLAAGDKFDWPITLELPSNTSLGSQRVILDFSMPPYAFRVYRDYQVGLGDVVLSAVDSRLDNGDLQIKQQIDNHTTERLTFECNLYAPERRRVQRTVSKLAQGRDTQIYILPDADTLRGREVQLRAQQIGGQRVLNLRWKIGENWEARKGPRAEAPRLPAEPDRPGDPPARDERPRFPRKPLGAPGDASS